MSATVINLIIQLIAGAVGGNAVGATMKNFDLGALGNTIAGAIGGAGGGTLLTALLPMLQGAAGNMDIGAVLGQAVGGGVAGAVVTVVVGLIKNMTDRRKPCPCNSASRTTPPLSATTKPGSRSFSVTSCAFMVLMQALSARPDLPSRRCAG